MMSRIFLDGLTSYVPAYEGDSDNEAVVVNITDVEPVEPPEEVLWIDPIHKG